MSYFVLGKGYDRFYPANETCPIEGYQGFFDGFFSRCKDTFLFVNILQFALVTLMYWNVGKGRYWKILFYGSVAGLIGSLLESGTIAFICRQSVKEKPYTKVITLFFAEFFWICNEYSIPFLNLIKMKAFSKGKAAKVVNYIVMGIFPLFAFCRFWIGYVRSRDGVIKNPDIDNSHGIAFACMAIADLVCTISIIYFVRKHNKQEFIKTSNITHYIEHSSYTILVCVDVVSIILAILCFVPTYTSVPKSITLPLHCVKCSFLLILATDALLFKYEANASSLQNSSNYNKYQNGTDSYNYSAKPRSNNNYSTTYNNYSSNFSNNFSSNIESSNNKTFGFSNDTYQKSIIKNYTNKPTSSSTLYESQSHDNDSYPSQNFGFLYQTKD